MSLNGLDNAEVLDAHQAALVEAGGWFLLKYASRDSVALLGRGKHGVSEARNTLAAYTEASPLYGIIMYRRRKILIKYVPEGTSRLLQARTTVHLQDVLERYSPYETLLELSSSEALNDTALAASIHLHTASPSPPSNRLDEIGEEEGDDETPAAAAAAGPARNPNKDNKLSSTSSLGAQRVKSNSHLSKRAEWSERSIASLNTTVLKSPSLVAAALPPRTTPPTSPVQPTTVVLPAADQPIAASSVTPSTAASSPLSPVSVSHSTYPAAAEAPKAEQEARDSTDTPPPLPPKASASLGAAEDVNVRAGLHTTEQENRDHPRVSLDRAQMPKRTSSLQPRAVEDDPYDFSKYDALFKPKVKLAPRPVNVATTEKAKRPTTARVSAMPAGVKPAIKKEPPRPLSQTQPNPGHATTSHREPDILTYIPPPIPDIPEYRQRPVSRGSVKSTPSHRSTAMTPDKIRLMKALELRKKQLRKSQIHEPVNATQSAEDVPEVPQTPAIPQRSPDRQPAESVASPPEQVPETQEVSLKSAEKEIQHDNIEQDQTTTDDESQHQSSKADSGISLRYGTPDTQNTDNTDAVDESHEDEGGEETTARKSSIGVGGLDLQDRNDGMATSAMDETSAHAEADASSSTASQTPTEKPIDSERGSEVTTIVPTIVMEDGSRPLTSDGEPLRREPSLEIVTESPTSLAGSSNGSPIEPDSSPRRQKSDLAKRRRGFVEPLQLDITSGNPDDFGSDDDDFLDELDSATFEEAQPILVARSPVATKFPFPRPRADTATSVRAVQIHRTSTATVDRTSNSPDPGASAGTPQEKGDPMSGFTRSVSSGISKRIQALAELSKRESNASAYSSPTQSSFTPETTPLGFVQQESRDRRPRRTPPTSRTSSYKRVSRNGGNHMSSALPGNENGPVWSVQHDPLTNRNSVTVTARINRPAVEEEESKMQKSEVLINHQRTNSIPPPIDTSAPPTSSAPLSPGLSTKSAESRSVHSLSSRFAKRMHSSSPALDDFPPPPNNPSRADVSPISNEENTPPKEGSRTGRWFKRMSTFGGSKRKSGIQSAAGNSTSSDSTVTIGNSIKRGSVATEKSDTPPAVVVGDLNVQFPDSLLWKRRIVTIDDSGNLAFAIAQAMEIHKGVAQKKYALSEFKMPYAPDVDRQELDHSIILEFTDGTALQTACEDSMAQRQILSILKTYWKAYSTTTQASA